MRKNRKGRRSRIERNERKRCEIAVGGAEVYGPTGMNFLVAIEAGALREPHQTEVTLVGAILHHQRAHVLI